MSRKIGMELLKMWLKFSLECTKGISNIPLSPDSSVGRTPNLKKGNKKRESAQNTIHITINSKAPGKIDFPKLLSN